LVERTDLARRIHVINDTLSEWLPTSGDINCGSLPIMVVSGFENKGIVELQREIASVVPALEASTSADENKMQEKIVRFSKLGGNPIWDASTKHIQSQKGGVNHKNFAGRYTKIRKSMSVNERSKDLNPYEATESAKEKWATTFKPLSQPSKRKSNPLHFNSK
jgi:hypothetical protein